MKKIAIFLGGFVSGVVAIIAFQQIQISLLHRHATPGNFDVRFAIERTSLEVDYEHPIFLTGSSGSEFEIDFQPTSDGRVDYSWSAVADPERKGSGMLFENYKTVGKTHDGRKVMDVGSELHIDIEDLQIEWSSGGQSTGWIYFHPDDITVSKTPNGEQGVDPNA